MVIKSSPLLFAFVLTIGMVSVVTAGAQSQLGNQAANPTSPDSNPSSAGLVMPGTYSSGTSGATTNGSGAGASGSANSGSSSSSSSSNNNNPTYTGTDDEDDPSLYRTKTQDSLGVGAMSRDEGQLTAKPRRREKVTVVDSTKKLPTSGTDPKFQGSLLHSSVTSIDDVSLKPDQAPDDQQDGQQDEVGSRFQTRRLVFKPQTTADDSKNKDKPRAAADSSPSPTATPTPASPNSPNR
jgi:hypothetical protein